MEVKIDDSWKNILQSEFDKPYFKTLTDFIKSEYKQYTCYPKRAHIFAAFNNCGFDDLRVVIIGQDPYHGQNQANGLSFSVNDGVAHPPSLMNIFKELSIDLQVTYPQSGNLEKWAKQGVLLLNATLTVRANEAGSHQKKGWEIFTDAVIQKISTEKKGVVFLLWGGFAKQKTKLIDLKKHCIFTSGHPSPLSANRAFWFGNKHFSKTNKVLENMKKPIIEW
jgi:uracil-DNA glycosylase